MTSLVVVVRTLRVRNIMTLDRTTVTWYSGNMHASHSSINSYLRCGKAFELEKIKNYPTMPAWWLIGGSAVHKVTEAIDTGDVWADTENMAIECLDMEYEKAALIEPDDTKWLAAGYGRNQQRYEHWVDKVQDYALQWEAKHLQWDWVELDVSTVLPSGLEIKGYIDRARVDQRITGFEIVDLKSGSTRPDSDQQLGIYKVLFDVWLNTHGTQYTRTFGRGSSSDITAWNYMFKDDEFYLVETIKWNLHTVDKMAQQWYSGVNDKVFLPVRGKNCERCSVADACFLQSGDTPVTREYDSLNPFHKE